MSSCYSAAELEKMRQEQLKRDIAENIRKIKAQLQQEHPETTVTLTGTNIRVSVFARDEIAEYYEEQAVDEDLLKMKSTVGADYDELDFSALLSDTHRRSGRLQQELDRWIRKIDERAMLSEKDVRDRTRLLEELSKRAAESFTDMEERLLDTKMRVNAFLHGAVKLTAADEVRIEAEYYEYCALCKLLDVRPVETMPWRISLEIERMTKVLEKRGENEYILNVITSIMEEMGCHVKEEAVLDHIIGQMFTMDGHPMCDVFVAKDYSGVIFEPVAQEEKMTAETRMKTEADAGAICSLYDVLEERAAREGVILKRVYQDPVSVDTMCRPEDVQKRKSLQKRKKRKELKARAMKLEE